MAVATIAAAALIIGACADQESGASRLSTEPGGEGDSAASYVTTGSAAIVDPRTHRMQIVKQQAAPGGVSASVVSAGGTGSVLQVPNGSSGVATAAGFYQVGFTDQNKHQHKVVLLYSRFGGPPAAIQHYVDGALANTSAYSWQRTSTGWVRTSSFMRVVRKGALVGTYATTTAVAPPTPGNGGGPAVPVRLDRYPNANEVQRMLHSVAYGVAFALAPQDASAQGLFPVWPAVGACLQEWLKYSAAAAVVVGLEAVIADAPVLTPLLAMQFAGAAALLGVAEDQLLICILEHQPGPYHLGFNGSGGGSGTGGTGGAGGSDCLEGSYAAHCTTPFTL